MKINSKNEVVPYMRRTYKLLRCIGMPVHCVGFRYIMCAVISAMEEPKRLLLLTKWLYPDAAKRCGTSPAALEKGIRQAVEQVWVKNPSCFSTALNIVPGRKPTNAQFISALFDLLLDVEIP